MPHLIERCSSQYPLPKLLNGSTLLNKMATKALDKNYLKTTPSAEPLVQIQNNFTAMFQIMLAAQFA